MIQANLDLHQVVHDTLARPIAQAGRQLIDCLGQDHRVLVCGNGGSAADSQHFAAELIGRFEVERQALPAVALTTDSSALTAIGNDYGFEQVFARQVAGLGRAGDVLLAISTSGHSANVIEAIRTAQAQGLSVIALTGRDGGAIRELLQKTDTELCVATDSTARIQEVHILILHCLCDLIDQEIATR